MPSHQRPKFSIRNPYELMRELGVSSFDRLRKYKDLPNPAPHKDQLCGIKIILMPRPRPGDSTGLKSNSLFFFKVPWLVLGSARAENHKPNC